ncbi:ATP-binding protein [Hyalangium gracile]|uniref:ATP-binding protein n=1 Tax=Hyalangium gracile TaxID=394092 RepID=UPI001CCA2229|nr:ATP-binding protein [Hyalangium gracile]
MSSPSPPRDSLPWKLLELQTEFIRGRSSRAVLERWLSLLLEQAGSQRGFLATALSGSGAGGSLQLVASSPPGWAEAEWQEPRWSSSQEPAPRSLRLLAEQALSVGQVVLADGSTAPCSLLALPLREGDGRVGLVGLALRPDGAPEPLLQGLEPALAVGASLLRGWHEAQRQEQAEEASRQLQAELEGVRQQFTSVEEELWTLDLSTQVLHPSRRWRALTGYGENEVEHTLSGWQRLCHPEDLPHAVQCIAEHVSGATPYVEFEYRARSKNGTWAWIRTRGQVVARNARGEPVRLAGTDADLTATKHSEERLSALLQAVPDLIFRQTTDGLFLDFSCSTEQQTLVRPEAFVGRNIRDLPLPQHVIELSLERFEHVAREGTVAVYEYELNMPEGRQSYEARVVRSGPGEVVSIVRNVTERRLVEERQAQLIQAEKLASLGQMAAGIAHEINNPVSYVTSNLRVLEQYATAFLPVLGWLREQMEAPDTRPRTLSADRLAEMRAQWAQGELDQVLEDMPELLRESLTGVRRIREIAQSLRVFAREDDGKLQEVDLNEELESTLRMVGNELKYKCEVKRDLEPLPRVTCHPTQLVQVFTNLLLNAGQAIENRGEIRIRTRRQEEEVVVEISDTGRGMTPETLSKLFTPFFTTKPRGQGTGLGLSISRDIVTRHGGRLEVRSEPGQGSTFTLYLPLRPPG